MAMILMSSGWARRKIKRVAWRFGAALRGARDRNFVFVFSTPRTGSYLLVDQVKKEAKYGIGGEVLNPMSGCGIAFDTAHCVLSRHVKSYVLSRSGKTVGAKIMLNQLKRHAVDMPLFTQWFPRLQGVILYRKDLLAQFQSKNLAMQSGEWLKTNNSHGSVSVDTLRFSKYVKAQRDLYQDAWSTLGQMGITVLAYEDFCAEPQLWLTKLTGKEVKGGTNISQRKRDILLDISNRDDLREEAKFRGMQFSGEGFLMKGWGDF